MKHPALPDARARRPDEKVPRPVRRRDRTRRRPWYWRLLFGLALVYIGVCLAMAYLENRLVFPGAFAENSGRNLPPSIDVNDPDQLSNALTAVQTVRYGGGGTAASHIDDLLPGRLRLRVQNQPNAAASSTGNPSGRSAGELGNAPGNAPGNEPGNAPEQRSKNWVVFFHGNGIRAVDLDRWINRLSVAFDANVFAAEYRGFTDDRDVGQSGVIADGEAAVQFVIDRFDVPISRIILYGRSLGGGVASAAAVRFGPAALVMDRTFDSAVAVAAEKYPFLPVRLLMKNRFDSAARLTVYDGPLVVVHGPPDTLVPYAAGRRLYDAAASAFKTFVESPGMGHLDAMSDDVLDQVVRAVLDNIRHHDEATHTTKRPHGERSIQ